MKLKKLKLHEISNADLSEKEMCRILGGGTKGCCQCGCHYAGKGGGSSSEDNNSANDAHGYVSDSKVPPCSPPETGSGGTMTGNYNDLR